MAEEGSCVPPSPPRPPILRARFGTDDLASPRVEADGGDGFRLPQTYRARGHVFILGCRRVFHYLPQSWKPSGAGGREQDRGGAGVQQLLGIKATCGIHSRLVIGGQLGR